MSIDRAKDIIQQLLIEETGKGISPLVEAIVLAAWNNQQYKNIEGWMEPTIRDQAKKSTSLSILSSLRATEM
jgi:hypothetical protein